jgi:hypothetical protein
VCYGSIHYGGRSNVEEGARRESLSAPKGREAERPLELGTTL